MSSISKPTETDHKRIDRLFLRFAARYGQLWRSQLKSDEFIVFMKNEWLEALLEFEDRHMNTAMGRCLKERKFPPTLPDFIELCQAAKKREEPLWDKPEYKKSRPEVGDKYLAKIKAMLK